MKTINETFTDEEFQSLLKTKGSLNWHDFILTLIKQNKGE
jgi:predicted CopG family antitoxin